MRVCLKVMGWTKIEDVPDHVVSSGRIQVALMGQPDILVPYHAPKHPAPYTPGYTYNCIFLGRRTGSGIPIFEFE